MDWLMAQVPLREARRGGIRVPFFDVRSRNWRIRDLLDSFTELPDPVNFWEPMDSLDQGLGTPTCSAFALTHFLGGEPFSVKDEPLTHERLDANFANELYVQTARLMHIRDTSGGISLLDALKGAQQQGFVAEYFWCGAGSGNVVQDVIDSVLYIGGVITGGMWTESMWSPRPSGLIEYSPLNAEISHAAYVTGVFLGEEIPGESGTHDFVVIQNSLGSGWGIDGGFCYMLLEDLETFLETEGEEVVPTEFPLTPFAGKKLDRDLIGFLAPDPPPGGGGGGFIDFEEEDDFTDPPN
jgi:hypothetical protein